MQTPKRTSCSPTRGTAPLGVLVAVMATLAFVAPARAQDGRFDGPYAVAHLKLDIAGVDVAVDGQRRTSTSWDRDVGFRLGYRKALGDRVLVGLEGGVDTSNTLEGRTITSGSRGVNFSFERRGSTVAVDGLAGFRPSRNLLVFGTVGWASAGFSRGAFAFDVGEAPPPEIVTNDRIHAVTFGIGLETRLAGPWLLLRVSATRERSQTFGAAEFGLSPRDFDATTAVIVQSATQVKLGVVIQF